MKIAPLKNKIDDSKDGFATNQDRNERFLAQSGTN
jgi:hypothetical protein